ncbi:MAG: plasmid stabilization protein [Planctomycetaceae bacterium]
MPRGDKSKYTDKQKRQAEKIEKSYRARGVSREEAETRAWATVNKMRGGGKNRGGSGRGKRVDLEPARKGGRLGGRASRKRSAASRSAAARKGARTRARRRTTSGAAT